MLSAWKESHRRESDSWPLPYQGSALPLSYCGLFYSLSLLSTYFFRSGVGFSARPAFFERKTGLEPATYSLEGYRSTKWATSASLYFWYFVGEGGLEPPNSSEDRFTVCCNCRYATPPICCPTAQFFECRSRADEGTRTPDRLITNQLLYQLSYIGFCQPFKQLFFSTIEVAKILLFSNTAKDFFNFFWLLFTIRWLSLL